MEYIVKKVDVPFSDDSLIEMYVHIYHTGDPQLDKLLGFFENNKYKLSINVKISHSPRVSNKTFNLGKINIEGCDFIISNNSIVMIMDVANITFTTKEEFAVLKMLLESSIFRLLLNTENTYIIDDDPDLLCTSSIYITNKNEIMLFTEYLSIKYRFEYTHESKIMDFGEFNIGTLVEFMNTVVISTSVLQKLKNVQIYLLFDDKEIPGLFHNKKHKIIIENTYRISHGTDLKLILNNYIKFNMKFPDILPTGCKSAKEIC